MSPQTNSRKVSWPAVVALCLVPLLAVAGLLGLGSRQADKEISAAVVNLDEAVTVEGQYIPMGRQLAAAMVDREGDNITWTLADSPSAAAGLRSGKYSAVVTIPKEFSASATSFSENDAATATQATIQVQVSDNAPVTDAALAQEIALLATDTVNATLTKGYLDGIYVGFNTVGEQFSTIVDGAAQLHDGSTQLADGALEASQGSAQLSDGMRLLSDNGTTLADGAFELVGGVRQLKNGSGQLATGAAELTSGADQLLGPLPQFANGAAAAISGVTPIRDGLTQVINGLAAEQDFSDLDQLKAGADGVAAGAQGLSSGLTQVDSSLQAMAGDQATMGQITAGVLQAAAQQGSPCAALPPGAEDFCPAVEAAFEAGVGAGVAGGWQAGVGAGSQALNTPPGAGQPSLIDGAAQLAGGATQLAGGVGQLATELPAQMKTQMATLSGGLTQIRDGANQLVTQAQPIVDNAPQLAAGATSLADGIHQFSDGVAQFDDGVGELQTGIQAFADGVQQYTDGVATAARGSNELTDGLVQLADGARQLDDGVGTFATELAKGADQVPTYSATDREKLATVVAQPVLKSDDLIASGQIPLVSLLLVSGIWLGALAATVALRPVPRNVISSRAPSVVLWARTVWLPAAIVVGQGLLLGLIGGVLLGVGAGRTLGLMVLLAALAASFVIANHALAAWLGNVGRGISLLLLVVTVALGLSSAANWLEPVALISPLHNGLLLVRTWLSDGSGGIGLAATALLMGAIALAASVVAISSRRRLTAAQYRRAA